MNSTFDERIQLDYCFTVAFFYIYRIIAYCVCSAGFLLNSICVLVFVQPKFRKSKSSGVTFDYFLFRCIYDALILALKIPVIYSYDSSNYIAKIIYIYSLYLGVVFTFCSKYSDVFAQLNRYVYISQRLLFLNKIKPIFVIAVTTTLASVFYLYRIFQVYIGEIVWFELKLTQTVNYTSNATLVEQSYTPVYSLAVWYNNFYYSPWGQLLNASSTIIRDMIGSALLIAFNVLILGSFKQAMSKKKRLTVKNNSSNFNLNRAKGGSSTTQKQQHSTKPNKAEQLNTLMVLTISMVTIIAHTPLMLLNLRVALIANNICFAFASDLFYLSSISINLFIFYIFNNQFKSNLIGLIRI
jgi:hypothetical protein